MSTALAKADGGILVDTRPERIGRLRRYAPSELFRLMQDRHGRLCEFQAMNAPSGLIADCRTLWEEAREVWTEVVGRN